MSRYFGKAAHTGFVVPNLDQSIERMLAIGVGPFFVMRNIRPASRYRGVGHDMLLSAAIVYPGNTQYEFIEQHDDTPSVYREFMPSITGVDCSLMTTGTAYAGRKPGRTSPQDNPILEDKRKIYGNDCNF